MTNHGASVLGRVSGLVIHADAPVSGLRPLDVPEPPDVCVRMRGTSGQPPSHETGGTWYVSPYRDERGIPLLTIRTAGSGYLLGYAEGTCFLVSASGREVDAWWEEPLTDVDAPVDLDAELTRGFAVECLFTPVRSCSRIRQFSLRGPRAPASRPSPRRSPFLVIRCCRTMLS